MIKYLCTVLLIVLSFTTKVYANPLVHTSLGDIQGVVESGIEVFKGIPYAKNPEGDLRFAPPQKAEAFKSTFKADKFCKIVPQYSFLTNFEQETGSFDNNYLCLNIYRKSNIAKNEKLPVYVWIYGGAFVSGDSSLPIYHGKSFAKNGVILVTLNYRLHALGFYSSKATLKEYKTTGNWGLLDQISALEWVHDHIREFGGDPNKVTIGGESAGAYSVSALLLSPKARGLFKRAIMQSGTILNYPFSSFTAKENQYTTYKNSFNVAKTFGADDSETGLNLLRQLDPMLLATQASFDYDFIKGKTYNYLKPNFDGVVLPRDPYKALASHKFPKVDVLIGYNTHEGVNFVQDGIKEQDFIKALNNHFGQDKGQLLKELYPIDKEHDVLTCQVEFLGDIMFNLGTKIFLDKLSEKNKVYAYHFDFSTRNGVVPHISELPYTFNTLNEKSSELQKDVADIVHKRFVNFIKTGDPNTDGKQKTLLRWPKYESKHKYVFKFDTFSTVETYQLYERLDKLEQIIYR